MPVGIYIMFGLIALFVVFTGFKMIKDSKVEAARIKAKSEADAAEAAVKAEKMRQLFLDGEKKELEQLAAMKKSQGAPLSQKGGIIATPDPNYMRQLYQNGTHFGPGPVPPGSFDYNNPRPGN
jgi:hypothetical protein